MKTTLFLALALTIALFSTSGLGLTCETCSDPNDLSCNNTVQFSCNSDETHCVSAIVLTSFAGRTSTQKVKSCSVSSFCPVAVQNFSLDVGSSSVLAQAVCCATDNCNSADATVPSTPAIGLLRCFGCDPVTRVCTSGISCSTLETHCFSASVLPNGASTAIPVHGCASESLCINSAASLSDPSLLSGLGTVQGAPTCCTTSNCNPPPTTATTTTPTTTTPITTTPTTTTTTTRTTTTTGATTAGASSIASLLLLQILALVLAFLS